MTWFFMLFGLIAGGLMGGSLREAVLGALVGVAFGQMFALRQLRKQNAELNDALKLFEVRFEKGTSAVVERLWALERNASVTDAQVGNVAPPENVSPPENVASPESVAPAENVVLAPAQVQVAEEASVAASLQPEMLQPEMPPQSTAGINTAAIPAPAPAPARPRVPRPTPPPSAISKAISAAKAWLLGGNVVLRAGVVLLFIGLAFLLRYATQDLVIPVEFRYAAVAVGGLAMIALGWVLRRRNESYALIMQGAGIGVMYLTVFAAFRLHPLLPSGLALALLIVMTAALILLALLQNAVGLASAAVAGAFAAPILTSTGTGNHVALFSYFALLNAALMVIAWHKAWRVLNVIGFVGTFGIGFAWGLRSYTPALFSSTEPFLILFFAMYVGIGLLFTRRTLMAIHAEPAPEGMRELLQWSKKQTNYVDASLMFGPPLVGFGLQYAVVSHLEWGPAFSALALGLFYLGLALKLRPRLQVHAPLLIDVYLALGLIFGTLAIPLALDAQWTAASWAVEGAGLYWVGMRQQRPFARLFALLLQLGAALNYVGAIESGSTSLLYAEPLGSLLLGIALLFSYGLLFSHGLRTASDPQRTPAWERRFLPVLAYLGLAFMYLLAPVFWWSEGTAIAWALAGLVTLLAGLKWASKTLLFCGLAVQLLGGIVLLTVSPPGESAASFWAPAMLAFTAFLGAWRLHLAYAQHVREGDAARGQHWLKPLQVRRRSMLMLGWSVVWCVFTTLEEVAPLAPFESRAYVALIVAALLLGAWAWVARRAQWGVLAHVCLGIPLIGAIVLQEGIEARGTYHPAAHWGWLAWTLALAMNLWVLKYLSSLLRHAWQQSTHVFGVWLLLAVLSLELHYGFVLLADPDSAWRWLGWVLVPCGYLWLMSSPYPAVWPVTAFARAYRVLAAFPVAILLLGWFWIVNVESSGNAAPLPFVPVLNPLELAMLLALSGVVYWSQKTAQLPSRTKAMAVAGASLFVLLTASVFRTAHHWADIPYQLSAQLASMPVQASLSILWTFIALALMIIGHRNGLRALWLVGGALIAVVVVKLFFVELGNRGGLERIISFMSVGVLLLIVGYFAPLPPRNAASPEAAPDSDAERKTV